MNTSNLDFVRYDEMPYTSYAFADSHPSRLKAIAQVFGLTAVPLENARILELGCASGGNLVPLAFYYPNMQLVGVDYSSVQIADGIATVQKLGLQNVELKHMSISDITPDFGLFDYIVCHGVYSWVPEDVQTAIMRVCQENLTDQGIAYISYNVYPGWKTHEITRDAMLFHTRNINNGNEQVGHARGMIQYMQEMSTDGSIFRHIMNSESELIQNAEPYYIAHEFLETHNSPCYFNQFISRAQLHDLTYLGESSLSSMFVETLGEEHKQRLITASEGNQVTLEQYLDFLRNRSFRQTLLVKNSFSTSLNRTINAANLKQIAFTLSARRVETEGALSHQYENAQKQTIKVDLPIQQTVLHILSKHSPHPMDCTQLIKKTKQKMGKQFAEQELIEFLERLLIIGFLTPWSAPFLDLYLSATDTTPTHPRVDPLVGTHAIAIGRLTSNTHQSIKLNPILIALLPLLDGSQSIENLTEHIIAAVQQEKIQFQRHNTLELLTDMVEVKKEAALHTQSSIELLKVNGFLIK